MKNPYMAAFAALDATPREDDGQGFVSPLGDQSTEVDREAETAAFVSRTEPVHEIETKPARTETTGGGMGRSPFAEAAGLYL